MSLTEQVLAACISVASKNNHGHMTGYHVWVMMDNMEIGISIPMISSIVSKNQSWWRQGLPRKQKDGWLIRELKEELWQNSTVLVEDFEDTLKDLRFELREANKAKDAMQTEIGRLILATQQSEQELAKLRSLWRSLNNAMNPRR
jgi:hypothetical protein